LPGLTLDCNLNFSASCVAEVSGMSNCAWPSSWVLIVDLVCHICLAIIHH
jgi:hypothetical protein